MQRLFHPEKGGIGKVTLTLTEYFRRSGHRVHILVARDSGYVYDGVYIIKSGTFEPTEENICELRDLVVKNGIDIVVNQQGAGGDGSNLAYASRALGCRLISVVHMSILDDVKKFEITKRDRFRDCGLAWLLPVLSKKPLKAIILYLYKVRRKRHFRKLVDNSDGIMVVSQGILEELTEILGVYPSNVTVMPNPVAYNSFCADVAAKNNTVLWVGRVDYSKRLDLFVNIWSRVCKTYPTWSAIVLGDGAELAAVMNRVRDSEIPRLLFKGYDVPIDYYKSGSILCFTSASEGFGLVLVEAMSYGCVPIAFDAFTSARQIICDGNSGYLIPPFDEDEYVNKLSELMSSQPLRSRCAATGMESAKRYSVDAVGEKWQSYLDAFVAKNLKHR